MKESRINRIFQWIVGILFIGFGLLYLLYSTLSLDTGWMLAGIVAVAALIRLIFICLPGSTSFAGNSALEIINGTTEALFGVFYILNAFLYIDFFYPLLAGLLAVMAVVRIRQSILIKKQSLNGWGSYLFIGILFLCLAFGLILFTYGYKINLQTELSGIAALIYGLFLVLSASFKPEPVEAFLDKGAVQLEAAEEIMENRAGPKRKAT